MSDFSGKSNCWWYYFHRSASLWKWWYTKDKMWMSQINTIQICNSYPHFLQFVRKLITSSNFLSIYVYAFYFIIQLYFLSNATYIWDSVSHIVLGKHWLIRVCSFPLLLTFCWGRMVKVATRKVRNVSTIICTRWCRSISIYIANISRGRKTKMKDWDYCQILTRKNDWRSVKPYIARLKGFTFSFLSMTAPSPTRRNMHAKILRACKLMIIGEEYEFRKKWYLHNIF